MLTTKEVESEVKKGELFLGSGVCILYLDNRTSIEIYTRTKEIFVFKEQSPLFLTSTKRLTYSK